MIKNFITFINESKQIKSEYQISHYNNSQKKEYFNSRLDEFSKNGFNSFEDYEWDLCPLSILKQYIDLCVKNGEGLTDYMLDNIKDENKKSLYIINSSLELLGLPEGMFNNLSEELKNYYINRKLDTIIDDFSSSYHAQLTEEEFDWCSNDIKLKYIENRLTDINGEDLDYLGYNEFEWCSDELKIKYINKLLNDSVSIDKEKFEICSDDLKKYYIDKSFEKLDNFDDYLFDLCSDDLKKYFLKLTKNIDYDLSYDQNVYKIYHKL